MSDAIISCEFPAKNSMIKCDGARYVGRLNLEIEEMIRSIHITK